MISIKKEKIIDVGRWLGLIVLFLLSCMFMYDFYKCLSGFIANKFDEPFVMLPMILSYLLPVVCFLFCFYDAYVKEAGKAARWIYAIAVVAVAVLCLVGIFVSFPVYASNNQLGVYETIPSVIVAFPYDAIIFHVLLIAAQAVNIVTLVKPNGKIATIKKGLRSEGTFSLGVVEYVILCVLAILAFVFVGAAFCGVNAMENVLYDGKYIFLWLWVLIVPAVDLLLLIVKPEKRVDSKKAKVITLSSGIVLNVLFGVLFWVFEVVTPGFIIHVGKPLFSIAFSISFPVEPLALIVIMAGSTIAFAVKLVLACVKKTK